MRGELINVGGTFSIEDTTNGMQSKVETPLANHYLSCWLAVAKGHQIICGLNSANDLKIKFYYTVDES